MESMDDDCNDLVPVMGVFGGRDAADDIESELREMDLEKGEQLVTQTRAHGWGVSGALAPGRGLRHENSLEVARSHLNTILESKRVKQGKQYDVFLSYAVSYDAKLVNDIYWQLSSLEVTSHGKKRKLKVFWDKECLRLGEDWEAGFGRALCSCSLVVAVISRDLIRRVGGLNPTSSCDNVFLEHLIAIRLQKWGKASILPLFVGDLNEERTHFDMFSDDNQSHKIESGFELMRNLPSHVIESVQEKSLEQLNQHVDVQWDQQHVDSPTVVETYAEINKLQGLFVSGPWHQATKAAVCSIHECINRIVLQQGMSWDLNQMISSTPQGSEVCQWLAENALSMYESTFAAHKLNSLRKVSMLSDQQLDQINKDFCLSAHSVSAETDVVLQGQRVALGAAVDVLKGTVKALPLREQLEIYSDPKVSGMNLIGAQNQLEVVAAKRKWIWMILSLVLAYGVYQCVHGFRFYRELGLQFTPSSVTAVSVQLSNDTLSWTDVPCPGGQTCVFDTSSLASDLDKVATNWFPHQQTARFVKILPQVFYPRQVTGGADFRLGILGGLQNSGSALDFATVQNREHDGKYWLQAGCRMSNVSGRWADPHERIGEVQCCLPGPRLHVCTRDGCLSGRDGTAKQSWEGAKQLCESKGWRLCSRLEMDSRASSGCCGSVCS